MIRKASLVAMVVAVPMLVGCGLDDTEQTGSVAQTSSVHLKGGANAEPSFRDLGLTLRASGELSGLGEGDIIVFLDATASATGTCTNPGSGAQQPAGHNPAPVEVGGQVTIDPDDQDKNGNVPFSVATNPPASPVAGAPHCPNPNWIETITDLSFTSATITVEQPQGTTVLTVDCTFSPSTSNGAVPARNVSCTSS